MLCANLFAFFVFFFAVAFLLICTAHTECDWYINSNDRVPAAIMNLPCRRDRATVTDTTENAAPAMPTSVQLLTAFWNGTVYSVVELLAKLRKHRKRSHLCKLLRLQCQCQRVPRPRPTNGIASAFAWTVSRLAVVRWMDAIVNPSRWWRLMNRRRCWAPIMMDFLAEPRLRCPHRLLVQPVGSSSCFSSRALRLSIWDRADHRRRHPR